MGIKIGGDDDDIIVVYDQGWPVQPPGNLLHVSLEGGQSRPQSKRQHLLLPEPVPRFNCSLVLYIKTQEHLPVPAQQVQCTEKSAAS